MKVIEIIPSFEPLGGAENLVFNLSKALKKDAEVTIISLYDNKNSYIDKSLESIGIKILYLGKRKGIDLRSCKEILKILDKMKPEILHLHLDSYIACLPSILARKSRFIYTFHTMISKETYGKKTKPRNLLIKLLIKYKYMFPVTISKTVDDSFRLYFGDYKRRVIYNGVDISRYKYIDEEKKYTFISVGSFNDIKNNLFMIKCVEKLINNGYDINYIILGSGKNYKSCKEYCLERNLTDRIILTGAVNNVEDYLAESSCLLLASHWEGNPLVVNEAIASGVWIIANSVGGVKDLVDETNGYLVTPESENEFINRMKEFLSNQKCITESIIPSNIERNRKKVDLRKTSSEYVALMSDLLESERL